MKFDNPTGQKALDPIEEEAPYLVISPRKSLLEFNVRESFQYRDLFFMLVIRDISVRYKQTLLGVAWSVLQPLSAMIVFTLFFGRLAKIPSDGVPYPLFSYSALVLWTFFAQAMNGAGQQSGRQRAVGYKGLLSSDHYARLSRPLLCG